MEVHHSQYCKKILKYTPYTTIAYVRDQGFLLKIYKGGMKTEIKSTMYPKA